MRSSSIYTFSYYGTDNLALLELIKAFCLKKYLSSESGVISIMRCKFSPTIIHPKCER